MHLFARILHHRFFFGLLFVLPLLLYFIFFESIAINANYIAYDDIHVLQVVEQWYNAATWQARWDCLTVGFPEHRIVFTRLMVLLLHGLTGYTNLKSLMMVSNLLWMMQLAVLFKVFFSQQNLYSKVYFIPFVWGILSVLAFENIFWATSSLGNFGVLFFVMMAAYFYTNATLSLSWAVLLSVLATFSYGNGLVSFLVGGVVLFLSQRWRDLGIVLGAFALTMLVYALTRSHASPPSVDLTNIQSYWTMLTCFFGFIGATASIDVYQISPAVMWLSVGWGAVLLIGLLGAIVSKLQWKGYQITSTMTRQQLFVLYLVVFVCITAAGVVYKRTESDQLFGMFKGRYRMYPLWLLVAAYGWLLTTHWPRKKWFLPTVIVISMAFNGLVLYYSVAHAVNNRRMAVVQEFNSMYNADLLGLKMFDLTGESFKNIQKLYNPTLFFEDIRIDSLQVTQTIALDSVYFHRDILTIHYGKDFVRPLRDFDDGAYILLRSPAHTYMMAGMQRTLPIKTFLRRGWYWDRGFTATMHRATIASGTYQIYVLIRQNGQNQWYKAEKTLER